MKAKSIVLVICLKILVSLPPRHPHLMSWSLITPNTLQDLTPAVNVIQTYGRKQFKELISTG